jgi:GNAT superfamily N-acetyltransferase
MTIILSTPVARYEEPTIIQIKTSEEVLAHRQGLSTLLQECVNEGSSIGFLAPLSADDANEYWTAVASLIPQGNLHLFIFLSPTAELNAPPSVLGTIQLLSIPKATHLHRAEILKLLVTPSARRQGIARRLMEHVENFAREMGKEMLTLDTATESAAMEMYRRLGWEEWGTCRDYASWPDGRRCDATFFRKDLGKTAK